MSPTASDVTAILAAQREHQHHLTRVRLMPWIPWLFVVGFVFAALGLFAFLRADRSLTIGVAAYALFFHLFGACVAVWFIGPYFMKPRIVPYFAQQLGEYTSTSSAAFKRGRALYEGIVALEQLASTLGVKPLSAFGFTDDFYDQKVQWHSASEGLKTTEALRKELAGQFHSQRNVAQDLEALESVLRIAAERSVDFSMTLRLTKTDSLQAVSSMEPRQGRFW